MGFPSVYGGRGMLLLLPLVALDVAASTPLVRALIDPLLRMIGLKEDQHQADPQQQEADPQQLAAIRARMDRLEQSTSREAEATVEELLRSSLRRVRWGDEDGDLAGDEEQCCSVCLCEFRIGDAVVRKLPQCSHTFHGDCLQGWVARGHSSCPLCRCSLLSDEAAAAAAAAARKQERQQQQQEELLLADELALWLSVYHSSSALGRRPWWYYRAGAHGGAGFF